MDDDIKAKAKNEVIKFFFHAINKNDIEKIRNALTLYNKQKNNKNQDFIADFIHNLENFITMRFESQNHDFQASCMNYNFFLTLANSNYNLVRFFRIYLEELTFCLLDIDKKLTSSNLSLDYNTRKDIQSFINTYIKLLHIYVEYNESAQKIQKQISELNEKITQEYMAASSQIDKSASDNSDNTNVPANTLPSDAMTK